MKIICDAEADVLRVRFSNTSIEEDDEERPGIILNHDKDDRIVGSKAPDASKRAENLRPVAYGVAG